MEHENIDQTPAYIPTEDGEGTREVWVSFCSCGAAFWDFSSQTAYDAWEQHEADNY